MSSYVPAALTIQIKGLKFIYPEKATRFCKISTVDLTGTTQDKSMVEISQNFVAFSEYMNFKKNVFELQRLYIAFQIVSTEIVFIQLFFGSKITYIFVRYFHTKFEIQKKSLNRIKICPFASSITDLEVYVQEPVTAVFKSGAHCLYRFLDNQKNTRSQFSIPGLRTKHKNKISILARAFLENLLFSA